MKPELIIQGILQRAIEDGLVAPMETLDDPDPWSRTSEELRGCVTLLCERLKSVGAAVPAPHKLPQRTA
jgi:hypothetical protein